MYGVFASPVTWDDARTWMEANGYYTRIVYPDLSGTWYMGGPINTGLPCLILQQNKMLFFINEMGGTSVGEFVDAGTVVAPAWGGLIGKITNDVKRINWANKSWWVRQKP